MDPNANLKEQRELAEAILALEEVDATRLAELVLALDEWIAGGGSIPDRWHNGYIPSSYQPEGT